MKALHVLIGVVLLLVLLAGAFFVLSSAFAGDARWSEVLDLAKGYKLYAIIGTLLLVFVLLVYALTSFSLPQKNQYIAYDIEGSSVSINTRAVQDFLSRLADEFAAIEELVPTLRVVGSGVDVQMDVKVRSGAQIPELSRMLQERARMMLREKVGLSDVREVRVRVQEIVGAPPTETASGDKPETFTL
ncbi:MAG: alkaline shock response membrane anchor protein AmaP [Kiritimatiellae bacterium]|nr:alkaline shock response membrane anchor protein AmaP [Kiritimatiellia bacterium]